MRPKPRTRRKPYELLFLPKHHGDELVNVHLELFRGVLDFLRRLDGEFDEDVAQGLRRGLPQYASWRHGGCALPSERWRER